MSVGRKHKQQGMERIILCQRYENGIIPITIEQKFRIELGTKYASPTQLPDGWTETLNLTLMKSAIDIVGDYNG